MGIARLASAQHGVISRWQLEELGLSREGVDSMVYRGRLHRSHAGVYAVGHSSLSQEGRWMAAVLAAGPRAFLSHRSAAAHFELLPARELVEVTARRQRRIHGALVHRRRLLDDEVTVRDGIPVTGPSRTIFDLAAVVSPERVERAINEAEVHRLFDPLTLEELVRRNTGRRGVAVVRSLLERGRVGLSVTRSDLEVKFLAFVDRFDLPRPVTNTMVKLPGRTVECDCLWRAERLTVELDGHAVHSTRASYESDRARDRELQAAGWTVVRVTWRQLEQEPERIAANLRSLLAPSAPDPATQRDQVP